MTVQSLCNISQYAVAILCDNCDLGVLIKCNLQSQLKAYYYLLKTSYAWYCIKCFKDPIPFSKITNHELFATNEGKKIKFTVISKNNSVKSAHHDLVDRLIDAMDQPDTKITKAKYLDPEDRALLINEESLFPSPSPSLPLKFLIIT